MQKRSKSDMDRRAWNILRLALLWARKGGAFILKKRLMLDLSHFMKSLRHCPKGGEALHYGDPELSFDATAMIQVRLHRPSSMRFKLPHIPCINPHAAAAAEFHDPSCNYSDSEARWSFLIRNDEQYDYDDDDDDDDDDDGDEDDNEYVSEQIWEEEGIDVKAEEFIANFYEQLKLQRQISHVRHKK